MVFSISSFKCKTAVRGRTLYIKLSGLLNEEVKLGLPPVSAYDHVVVDFDKLTGINSCGIREWMLYLNKFPADMNYVYINCHPPITDQMQMIPSFAKPHTKLKSFYARYICDHCEFEGEVRFETTSLSKTELPDQTCSRCGSVWEFAGDQDEFLAFLKLFDG